eukprot:975132-Pelagomonas_calceolata.AAC.5
MVRHLAFILASDIWQYSVSFYASGFRLGCSANELSNAAALAKGLFSKGTSQLAGAPAVSWQLPACMSSAAFAGCSTT